MLEWWNYVKTMLWKIVAFYSILEQVHFVNWEFFCLVLTWRFGDLKTTREKSEKGRRGLTQRGIRLKGEKGCYTKRKSPWPSIWTTVIQPQVSSCSDSEAFSYAGSPYTHWCKMLRLFIINPNVLICTHTWAGVCLSTGSILSYEPPALQKR